MKPKPPIEAVIYARFSDRPGADYCESCEHQLVDLRAFCERRGFAIVGEFSDEALSGGSDWEDRAGMFAAVEACRRGTVFIVRSWDRLFRDVERASIFRSMLHARGVRIMSANGPGEGAQGNRTPTEDQASADLMRNVLLAIAEYERQIVRARTSRAMRRHQTNGRRMGGEPPIGQTVDPEDGTRIVMDQQEQAVVDRICQLHSAGESARQIARTLTAEGAPRRGSATSGRWSHKTVLRVLRRVGMIGETR